MNRDEKGEELEGVASSHPERWHNPTWQGQTVKGCKWEQLATFLSVLSLHAFIHNTPHSKLQLWQHWAENYFLLELCKRYLPFWLRVCQWEVQEYVLYVLLIHGKGGCSPSSSQAFWAILSWPFLASSSLLPPQLIIYARYASYIAISCAPTVLQLMGLRAL